MNKQGLALKCCVLNWLDGLVNSPSVLCQVHWLSFQTHCPRCKSREAGCSCASLHSIINVCVRRPLMAANPISTTEIKSCWRQRSSPSLTNNDFAFVAFMKMMDHQNCSLISSPTSTRVLIPCFPFCVFPPHSLFIYCRFERVVGGVDEIKEQQRRQLLIVDPLKDEKVLNRRRAFAERPIYRSLVMLSWGQASISLNHMLCWWD